MARGQYLNPNQQGIVRRYYKQIDSLVLNRLSELVSDLAVGEDPKKTPQLWARAQETLLKTPADPMRIARIVSQRSVEQLAKLVGELNTASKVVSDNPPGSPGQPMGAGKPAASNTISTGAGFGAASTPDAAGPAPSDGATPESPAASGQASGSPTAPARGGNNRPDPKDPEVQKSALAAFRKRLKLSQLERDSKLSRAFTTGNKTTILSIQPPNTFGNEVWAELANSGKLKYDGNGLYKLP